jgi:hypothetical protein
MPRHFPYRHKERGHWEPSHRAGEIVDAIWENYKQEAHWAETYMRRKTGEVPWIDPNGYRRRV